MRAIFGPLVVVAIVVALWVFVFDRNPGGISDAKYAEYKRLPAPRLLYSCTRRPTSEALLRKSRECSDSGRAGCDQEVYELGKSEVVTTVDIVGNQGTSTYEDLLRAARKKCAIAHGDMGNGKFEVLEAVKN